MLDNLKEAGRNLGREFTRTWESLSEGWRELMSRSSDALTHFTRGKAEEKSGGELAAFPRWGLLAGEIEETDKEIVVRIETPGMEKEDCSISIEENMLYISGEKRYQREEGDSTYHVMERAYGSFRRAFPLPRNVDTDNAVATYRNGVLSIRLPKTGSSAGRTIPLS